MLVWPIILPDPYWIFFSRIRSLNPNFLGYSILKNWFTPYTPKVAISRESQGPFIKKRLWGTKLKCYEYMMNTKGLVSAKKKNPTKLYWLYIYIRKWTRIQIKKRFWSGLVIFQTIHIIHAVCKRKRKRLVRQKIEKMFHYSIFTLKPKSKKNVAIQSEHLFLFAWYHLISRIADILSFVFCFPIFLWFNLI